MKSMLTMIRMKKLFIKVNKYRLINNIDQSNLYFLVNFIVAIYEADRYGYFDKVTMADPLMKHPDDLKIEKNYYISPKSQYYCDAIYGKMVNRKKQKCKKGRTDSLIRSSRNIFHQKPKESSYIGRSRVDENFHDYARIKHLSSVEKFIVFFFIPEFMNQVFIGKIMYKHLKLTIINFYFSA